ncbi:hypothetical protein [Microcoleus sp. AT8-B5]
MAARSTDFSNPLTADIRLGLAGNFFTEGSMVQLGRILPDRP